MSDLRGDKIIDSREVIKRIEELEGERETLADELEAADECVRRHHDGQLDETGKETEVIEYLRCRQELKDWDEENTDELTDLKDLAEECEGYGDWAHGETLILDSHFEDYAMELAKDTGAITGEEAWPLNHLDWEAAAEELQSDYTQVTFGNDDYWMRS